MVRGSVLRCSQLGAGAEFTSLAVLVSFKHAAPSRMLMRAARASHETCPALARLKSLRCSAPHKSPGNSPGLGALASRTPCLIPAPNARLEVGSARRRAIWARPRAHRSGSGALSALQQLTWRHLFERSERREFAAADLRSEHRGESARQSRPGHHEHGGGPSQLCMGYQNRNSTPDTLQPPVNTRLELPKAISP